MGAKAQRRRAAKAAAKPARAVAVAPAAEPMWSPQWDTDDGDLGPPDCPGMGIAHIDGTEGSCGPTCTGGFHACAEDCLTDPQECSYCVTLLCPAREMVEHHDGTVECEVAAGVCTALAHGWHQVTAVGGVLDLDEDLGGRACWDVAAERALAYACGPDCRIAPPGPSAEYIAHVAELMAGDAVHRAAAACSVCQ